jgi:hypothetical protein
MNTLRPSLLLLVLALAPAAASAVPPRPATPPDYRAADPNAPPVTEANLLASERFWPYRVALTAPFHPPGREKPLPVGLRGILVRVEEPGDVMRVDFTRDGKHRVPVDVTDVVERANQVRTGKLRKIAPNFVHAIGPRLVDAEAEQIRYYDFAATLEPPGFLAVHADPRGSGFAQMAKSLAPLHRRHGVLTVLFPQGRHPDIQTRAQLRELGWPVPFVLYQLAEGYTRSRLDENVGLPAVMLQTPDGRVVYQSAWTPDVVPELTGALDAAFGANPVVEANDVTRQPGP